LHARALGDGAHEDGLHVDAEEHRPGGGRRGYHGQ
jgi:hypothetical protein